MKTKALLVSIVLGLDLRGATIAHGADCGQFEAMAEMAREGNFASRSDLEVGAKALEAGIWGASRNVAVNLPGIEDEGFRRATGDEAERLAARAASMREAVLQTLAARTE